VVPKGLEKCVIKNTKIMFKNISWSEYLLTVGLVVVLWYLALGLYHFRKVLMGLLSGKQPHIFFSGEDSEGESVFEDSNIQDFKEEQDTTSLHKEEVTR
jgi:hypothetical protein